MTVNVTKKIKVEIPITWKDPPPAPPRGRGRAKTINWEDIFNLLMEHPKRWALVDCVNSAQATKTRLTGDLQKKYPQLQLPYHWEFAVRNYTELYIRYLGEELPQ